MGITSLQQYLHSICRRIRKISKRAPLKILLILIFFTSIGTVLRFRFDLNPSLTRQLILLNSAKTPRPKSLTRPTAEVTGSREARLINPWSRLFANPDNSTGYSEFSFLKKSFVIDKDPVRNWIKTRLTLCDGGFIGFQNLFASLQNVVVDPSFCSCTKGGEAMKDVLNQKEGAEYLELKRGFFQMNCTRKSVTYHFDNRDHLARWPSLISTDVGEVDVAPSVVTNLTLVVMRYEYANLYHTMTDWYNAFLMLMLFKRDPQNVTVLWVDGHPQGVLDHVWRQLFGNVMWIRELKGKVIFKQMVWSITGYFSLLFQHNLKSVPYLEEFRTFFLHRFNIKTEKPLDCKRLRFLFIWRRNYVSHPRNPVGKIERKVKNEDELESLINATYPGSVVTGIQTDNMTMNEQLRHIVSTDVLIGMHGAGLTLALFLPKHAALLEIYPKYKGAANRHFQAIAKWRGIAYQNWQNGDPKNEFKNFYTYIPPSILKSLVENVVNKICS